MELKIPSTISSPQDLTALQLEIKEYAKWLSHESIKQKVGSQAAPTPPSMSEVGATFLRAWSTTNKVTAQNLDALLAALDQYKTSAPIISITLAAPPSGGLRAELVQWCRDNIAPNVLINFKFNATILGGMVVRSGSRIYDWSFRRQILDARAKFPEVLRSV